jgi:hypothetical protein
LRKTYKEVVMAYLKSSSVICVERLRKIVIYLNQNTQSLESLFQLKIYHICSRSHKYTVMVSELGVDWKVVLTWILGS